MLLRMRAFSPPAVAAYADVPSRASSRAFWFLIKLYRIGLASARAGLRA
jgi:hypothetical protein